jgi:serine/threonine-protein kinase RsbW
MVPGATWDTENGLLGHAPLRLTVPGVPAAVTIVRRFVRSVLCGHPTREDVELLVSEIATNAVRHTASAFGGRVTVEITAFDAALVHVTVIDDGAATEPSIRARDALSEYEHGLLLVAAIAKQYGTWATESNRACWFDVGP